MLSTKCYNRNSSYENSTYSAHAHEVLYQFLYIYIIYICPRKKHFAKNEILLIPPLSGELPIEAKKSEFRHERSSYSKIKVNNQLNMRIETKPAERSIESKLLHRFAGKHTP